MVEKSVELGVEKISFVRCATSERKAINMERLEKIVVNAMKQSQQAWLPELVPIMPLEEFIRVCKERHRFIAHVDSGNPVLLKQLAVPYSDYVAMVGPEGDFTGTEIASAVSHGFKKVSLGSSRLRSETAGLAIVMTLNLLNQQ